MAPRAWDAGKPVAARGRYYVECAAGATTPLKENPDAAAGDAGDELDWLWLFPTSTTPGAASLLDGANVIWPWPAGVTLQDTRPIFVPLNLRSREGGWSLTLPASFTALAAGAFS